MPERRKLAALLGLLAAGEEIGAEDRDRTTHTVNVEIRAERDYVPPRTYFWVHRTVLIPNECEYLDHDIELLDEFPKLAPGAKRLIYDSVEHHASFRPPGFSSVMFVGISPYRPVEMEAGPARIAVKLSITLKCTSQALDQLKEQLKAG